MKITAVRWFQLEGPPRSGTAIPEVRMMGQTFVVKAEIARIHSFSAHADRDELVGWLEAFMKKPEKVFLIHGEEKTLETFSENLRGRGFYPVIPRRGNNVMS